MLQMQHETDTIQPISITIKLAPIGIIFETIAFNH